MYAEGRGVPQDRVRAYMWLSLSAEQGHQKAVGSRNLVTKGMTPAQIADAEKLARDWKANKQRPQ
jgi:TPR repeat protein